MISAKTFLIAAAALLTATFAPATAVSAETDTLRLSREECVAIGLQESPTVRAATSK